MEAKMNNMSAWIAETDPQELKSFFSAALVQSGFGVLSHTEQYFEPFGYTGLYLLSESHFAIHTFPEHGRTYIELSSCVDPPYFTFLSILNKAVKNGHIK